MEQLAKLIAAISSFAWPALFLVLIFKFSESIKKLIDSARGRKFTIKVAGNELTMEEASEQTRVMLSDLQTKLAELEKVVGKKPAPPEKSLVPPPPSQPMSPAPVSSTRPATSVAGSAGAAAPADDSKLLSRKPKEPKRILWVDDNPKNNSFLVASMEERGDKVDIALNTGDGLEKFKAHHYDVVISDMARPEDDKAGILLAKQTKNIKPHVPVYIFCGSWAAQHMRNEALSQGVDDITSSATSLLGFIS